MFLKQAVNACDGRNLGGSTGGERKHHNEIQNSQIQKAELFSKKIFSIMFRILKPNQLQRQLCYGLIGTGSLMAPGAGERYWALTGRKLSGSQAVPSAPGEPSTPGPQAWPGAANTGSYSFLSLQRVNLPQTQVNLGQAHRAAERQGVQRHRQVTSRACNLSHQHGDPHSE